jgi:phage terminase large subunit-like protein
MFATRFSIVSSVYETRRNNFVAFEVRMRNLDGLSLGLPVPEPKQIHPCYKLAVVDGRMQFPITKVWREFYSGSVYDLQTSTGYFDLAGITSHNSDLTHELKANPEYKILDYSINEQLDPIWQEHWSRARLAQRKSEIGDLEFDRGFRNIALSGHVTIVREDWIKYVKEIPDSARVVYLGALDPASGQNMGNDYTAFVALAVDVQAKKAYVFLQRQARMTFPEQIDFLKEQAAAKPFHYIAIEEVNYQASIRQWCDAHCPMPLVGIKPTVGKAQRLQRATLYMNNGSVLFLDNMHPEEYSSQARDDIDLVTQLRRFPLAAHDDLLDAFVYAVGMASRLFLDEVEEAANDVGEMDDESKYIGDTRVRVLGSAS